MMNRFKKTMEVTVSKIIPAGAAWQFTSACVPYDPTTFEFALSTGVGEALGVVGGHIAYNRLFNSETISTTENINTGGLLGVAAMLSGTAWQPTVNLLQSNGAPMGVVVAGTGMVCGASFFTGLRAARAIRGPEYSETILNDAQLSVSIGGATGGFVLSELFIDDLTPLTDACVIAGMSTSSGFTAIQNTMNLLVPGQVWTDPK